ncbi:MAG: ABC transporter permease [Bdellovibrionales bacterium]
MAPGLSDLLKTLRNPYLFMYLAMSDIKARYKRSVLGPLWITLSTAIGVVGLGFIWSALFHLDKSVYIPTLSIGLILWQFISGSIIESSTIFVRYAGIIKNVDLPISLYPAQLLVRQLLILAHNIPLYFLVILVLGVPINLNFLWFFPGFLLVVLNLFWIMLLIGILGARFRDLEYLIGTVMPLLMFFTPVMYRPNALPYSKVIILLNPLADMIEIIRYPLLGEPVPGYLFAVNIALFVVGGAVTLFLFNKKRDRVALWV